MTLALLNEKRGKPALAYRQSPSHRVLLLLSSSPSELFTRSLTRTNGDDDETCQVNNIPSFLSLSQVGVPMKFVILFAINLPLASARLVITSHNHHHHFLGPICFLWIPFSRCVGCRGHEKSWSPMEIYLADVNMMPLTPPNVERATAAGIKWAPKPNNLLANSYIKKKKKAIRNQMSEGKNKIKGSEADPHHQHCPQWWWDEMSHHHHKQHDEKGSRLDI